MDNRSWNVVAAFARLALAAAFISAVADRFGIWGRFGDVGVSWGTMPNFYHHVAKLTPWAPSAWIPGIAWFVTVLEGILGIGLIAGYRLREIAAMSALLLLIFAASMMAFQSMKLTFNFSVLTCAACACFVYLVADKSMARTSASAELDYNYQAHATEAVRQK